MALFKMDCASERNVGRWINTVYNKFEEIEKENE